MAYNDRNSFIRRKEPLTMEQVIDEVIRSMKLANGLNEQRVYVAWDEVTGAGPYTLEKRFRNGTLTVSLKSSMVRSHLMMQRDDLVAAMNRWLLADDLFVKEEGKNQYVKQLVLK